MITKEGISKFACSICGNEAVDYMSVGFETMLFKKSKETFYCVDCLPEHKETIDTLLDIIEEYE